MNRISTPSANYGRSIAATIGAIALFLGPSTTAFAVDGVLEINQACAVNTGCFAGDTAGFPVRILNGGSYRLTSDLVVPEATGGIAITNVSVPVVTYTIDLNGFSIIGPAVCNGIPVTSCTSGTAPGISSGYVTTPPRVSVSNGSVRGFTSGGVALFGDYSTVRNVFASGNGGIGIAVESHSKVIDSVAALNGSIGIWVGKASSVAGSSAYGNGSHGIIGLNGGSQLITRCQSYQNAGVGLSCDYASSFGCVIEGSSVHDNGNDGVQLGPSGVMRTTQVSDNAGSGVTCRDNCLLEGNTITGNTTQQILFYGPAGYRANVISGTSTVSGAGAVELGTNMCNGNTTCP